MYKMAIELAGDNGLSPDSYDTSKDAMKIWNILLKDKKIDKKVKNPHDNELDPLNNVYFDVEGGLLSSLKDKITFKKPEISKKPEIEPELEPFDVERDWQGLYDDDIF